MIKKLLFTSLFLENISTAAEPTIIPYEYVSFKSGWGTLSSVVGPEYICVGDDAEIFNTRIDDPSDDISLMFEKLTKTIMSTSEIIKRDLAEEREYLKENGQFISMSQLRIGHITEQKEENFYLYNKDSWWSSSLNSMSFSVVYGSKKTPLRITNDSRLYIPKKSLEAKYVERLSKRHNFALLSFDTDAIQIDANIQIQESTLPCEYYECLHKGGCDYLNKKHTSYYTFTVPVKDFLSFKQADSIQFFLNIIGSNLVVSQDAKYFKAASVAEAITSREQQPKLQNHIIKHQQRIDLLEKEKNNLTQKNGKKNRGITRKLNRLDTLILEHEKSLKRDERTLLNLKKISMESCKIYQGQKTSNLFQKKSV